MRCALIAGLASLLLMGAAHGFDGEALEEPLHPVCQQLHGERSGSLDARIALGVKAWKLHSCYRLAHGLLNEGADEATGQGRNAVAFDALLALADMHWESRQEERLEQALRRMQGLLLAMSSGEAAGLTRLRAQQIRYYEAELMMLRGRYQDALPLLSLIIEDEKALPQASAPVAELLALAYGSRAYASRMALGEVERTGCRQDAERAIALAADRPDAIQALGRAYKNRGRCESANERSLPWYQQGYAECWKAQAAACAVDLLNMMAIRHREQGEFSVALRHYWRRWSFQGRLG